MPARNSILAIPSLPEMKYFSCKLSTLASRVTKSRIRLDSTWLGYSKLVGFLLGCVAWILGIVLANSRCWRVWEFKSKSVPVVFLGLWEVSYVQMFPISGVATSSVQSAVIDESWALSNEVIHGQDLILLANFMMSAALVLAMMTIYVSWNKGLYPEFFRLYYRICAFLLLLSSCCTGSAVVWNFTVDFSGKTTLDFPSTFPVKKEALTGKRHTYVLPLGITAASLSLLSALSFFVECYLLKQYNQVKPIAVPQTSKKSI